MRSLDRVLFCERCGGKVCLSFLLPAAVEAAEGEVVVGGGVSKRGGGWLL